MPVRDSWLMDTDVHRSLIVGSVLERCEVRKAAVLATVASDRRFENGIYVAGDRVPGRVVTVEVEISEDVVRSGSVEIDLSPPDPDQMAVIADVRAAGLIEELLGLRPSHRGYHALFTFSGRLPGRVRRRVIGNLDVFRECGPCARVRVGGMELRFLGGSQVFGDDPSLSYEDVIAVRNGEPVMSAWRPASESVISRLGAR